MRERGCSPWKRLEVDGQQSGKVYFHARIASVAKTVVRCGCNEEQLLNANLNNGLRRLRSGVRAPFRATFGCFLPPVDTPTS
ncbi:uncharacterized protein LACBIDRAFT_298612 [Laccaria bicolor S238N-H82]|uniref:Predicted protein n=1 Tax=Laccaria bicolor (strain S238N-H82 / ATCC MYA-4686) TaxID=486041 RepID=B0DD82_LACBS|nr:uncharacterized protein LACBIDRAFT_298612 [Laccaria bicolor S238N-H82]EDR07433.1 predicted protein [Laccaria bicolor S238N-H82]|eukprot:XP_001881825.1 predicted protein [Laccaria bicolor S238N-H82]